MNWREFFTSNPWWGKLLGAFFGYLIGGPAGALFGILIGNLFDRGLIGHYTRPHWYYHREKRKDIQHIFFEATFLVMGHLAKADGRVSEQEIHMANTLMNEMRLSHEQKKQARQLFNQGKAAAFNLGQTLTRLQEACHDNPDLLKLFMDIQYRFVQTDGLSAMKLQALNVIFRHMGFAPLHQQYRFYEDFGYQSAQGSTNHHSSSRQQNNYNYQDPQNTLKQAYTILEISSTATKQEVKKAYRRLISRNHPDKLIAQGLPENMIKIANDKTQKIRKAYEIICASKGW